MQSLISTQVISTVSWSASLESPELIREKHHYSQNSSVSQLANSKNYWAGESTLKYLGDNDFRFSNSSLACMSYFTFEANNKKNITNFILKYKLNDFLLWLHLPLVEIFGKISQTLKLNDCWDDSEAHLVLTLFSGLEDMDKLSLLEDHLFTKLEDYPEIDYALQYIVIAQR